VADLYERARRVLPGGVTAAARVNSALGGPFYVSRAEGPYLYDADGRRYAETSMSNGASLLGHGHPRVVAAVQRALELGIACMADGEPQVRLAERLVEQVPCLEMVRFTTSGTEATLYAARIARAYTGRPTLLKFAGHFHGFNDQLAFNFPRVGDAARTPRPETDGMPPGAVDGVLLGEFNDLEGTRRLLAEHGDRIAAVVLEPIAYDMGAVRPGPGFLEMLREETARRGIVLLFDEILSGYRTGPDCAQGHLGVTPDLCTIGKAIGGGVPLSAFGGRRELMGVVTPLGPAAHTGTYNAHLIPILAAHAFLDAIAEEGFWERLLGLHARLYAGLDGAFRRAGLPVRVQGVGARFGLYFGLDPDRPVESYRQAAGLDRRMMDAFGREMLDRGVYFNPAWHHGISAMHDQALVDRICAEAEASGRAVAAELAAAG